MGKISKQPTHKGIVIISKFDEYGNGFGFIEPIGDGARENNVFFSTYATQGAVPEVGDEVSFIYSHGNKPERGPRAFRVWIRKPAIESYDREQILTLAGEHDT